MKSLKWMNWLKNNEWMNEWNEITFFWTMNQIIIGFMSAS